MAMDGLNLRCMLRELHPLQDGKIEKIQQPDRDSLLLLIHSFTLGRVRLILNIHSENGRVQLTERTTDCPPAAPAFCMLLRKYLIGCRIESIAQTGLDRILTFTLRCKNEFMDDARLLLVVELMGKHGNIFLLGEDGRILDCLRHFGPSDGSLRLCLPNVRYEAPPIQDKQDLFCATPEELNAIPQDKRSTVFSGLSRQIARCLPADGAACKRCLNELDEGQLSPCILSDTLVLPFQPAKELGTIQPFPTLSKAMDALYASRDTSLRIRRQGASLKAALEHAQKRTERMLASCSDALAGEADAERYRLYGELLTGCTVVVPRGAENVVLSDWYLDPPAPITVPLDPRFGLRENAKRYFKRYQKSKTAREYASKRMGELNAELNYLEGASDALGECTTSDELMELKDELIAVGYLPAPKAGERTPKHAPGTPLTFVAADGVKISVGKNNVQNDRLTRAAAPDELWLHVKDQPGSHVILHSSEPSREALLLAASLAAYHSHARASDKVAVDYTQRRYVKKPGGAKPGFVIYTNQRTLYVTPSDGKEANEALDRIQ